MRRRQSFETFLIGKSVLMREGIVRILREENFRIRASVSSPSELTGAFRGPQLLFLIVHTGDDFALAIDQIQFVKDQHPSGRIVVVADHYRSTEPDLAFKVGAAGYLVGAMSCAAFVKSIELVMMGEAVFPPVFQTSAALDVKGEPRGNVASAGENNALSVRENNAASARENHGAVSVYADDTAAPQLSPRELAILRCLINGNSNKCIARKIDIAEATVKVHVKAILRKIRVQNRTQAAIWGMNHPLPTQPADDMPHLPSIADANEPLSNAMTVISAIKRNGSS
jgi:two-component system nitrate/nitrite response regulator NarL